MFYLEKHKRNLRRNKNIISKWHNCIPEKAQEYLIRANQKYPALIKNKKFLTFGILKKTASHRHKPENTIHNEENQSIETLKNYTDATVSRI